MINQNQQKIRIVLTEGANTALLDILKKYSLEENEDDIIEKLSEEKTSYEIIIDKLAKEFTKKEISEKDFFLSLQKNLNVSEEVAKKIAEDIKNNFIPLLEKIPETQFEVSSSEKELTPENLSEKNRIVMIEPSLQEQEEEPKKEEPIQSSWKKTQQLAEQPSEKSKEEKQEEIKIQDAYREPIE